MTSGGNPGLTLALPITLGLILLMMISIVVIFVFVVKRKRHVLEKWNFWKVGKKSAGSNSKVRTISNKSYDNQYQLQQQQQQGQQQQVRLFPMENDPTRDRCGLLQVGDIYYEEKSKYQAGKLSREAADLMSQRMESRGLNHEINGKTGIPAGGKRPKSEDLKMDPNSNGIYERLKGIKLQHDGVDAVQKNVSYEEVKRITDSNSDLNKKATDKRRTFIAMYPLTSASGDELNLSANDVIYYLGEKKKGWMKGEKKESGEIGWFPRSHVREGMNQAPDTSMFVSNSADIDDDVDGDDVNDDDSDDGDSSIFECVVRHEYEATYDGDLSLRKGEVVLVRETLENGWWLGESAGMSGFFPGSYVQICDSLVTRSCVNLSEEQKKYNSLGKRNFPGKQFIQKLSAINLGTLKKGKSKRKMRKESIKVMGRLPAPEPSHELKAEPNKSNLHIPAFTHQDKTKISLNHVSTLKSDPVYGNLPECSANSSVTEKDEQISLRSFQKPIIPVKQKILETMEPSKNLSTVLNGKSSVNFQRNSSAIPSSLSKVHCSTTSLEIGPFDNTRQARLSLNFGEELKSRVNMRMKAEE